MHENFPRSSAVNPVPQGRATPVEYLPVGGPRYANNDGSAKPPPLPYAHMQSTAGDPVSGVPGGPQPRYNPFTDGPAPVDNSSWTWQARFLHLFTLVGAVTTGWVLGGILWAATVWIIG